MFLVVVSVKLSVMEIAIHHRDTEDTEAARRLAFLCDSSVLSVPLW